MRFKEYKIFFTNEVKLEIFNIMDWYEVRDSNLGKKFFNSLISSVALLARFPNIYMNINMNQKKITLKGFPFCLYYKINEDEKAVIIVRCKHFKLLE